MVREAVILAAGRGCRLGERTEAMPKGFLELGGEAIVERSIRQLAAHGMEKIVIGTGHCREWYERLARNYPEIVTVYNPEYARTGSMGTLETCASEISGDFLLLESDLVYDPDGLRILLEARERDLVLASGRTDSGDEVYLEVDDRGFLTGLSKNPAVLKNTFAELVGITRLRRETLIAMCTFAKEQRVAHPLMEYETALCRVAQQIPVAVRKVEFFTWCEIDDEHHLKRARDKVFPRILEKQLLACVRREILLNPGPATTTDSVKRAQVVPDICPREREMSELIEWIRRELAIQTGAPDEYEAVLFGGSGTAADEAMIASCVPEKGRLLVIDNGAYGARMAEMARIYRLDHVVLRRSACERLDPAEVAHELEQNRCTHLAMVYHETTTGLLNPVSEIGRYCRRCGIVTLIDGVSAFGGIPIDFRQEGIDFLTAVSNKNLQSVAGISMVFCRRTALAQLKKIPGRSFYLNLYEQAEYFRRHGQFRFTPPVQALYALRQAILEWKHETFSGRIARYRACGEILSRALPEIGLTAVVPEEAQSHLITAIREPVLPGYDFSAMHDWLREHGFTIYPGKLDNDHTFRVANIGDIRAEEMMRFVSLLKEYLEGLRDSNRC